MWFVALFLCLVAGSRQLSVSEFTVPRSVAAGEEARLTCRYELAPGETEQALYVKWWWAPINASDSRAQLYQRIMGHKPTALRHNIRVEAFDSIVITGAAPPDSGRYECEVSNAFDEIRKHDDLIVYTSGSGPELNVTLAEDDDDGDGDGNADGDGDSERNVVLSCTATDVAPEPDLVFTVDGQPLDTNHKEVTWSPSENVYDVVANASVSAARAAGATLACELVYTDARVTHPQYVHTVPFQLDTGDGATGLTAFSFLVLAALQIAMLVVN
ncbi:uncharacterized protein LOC121738074 isoform X2 [Aricia agestis]|uniref:uncharacterized protein LOC121738074 isoform X2 n=1 Tax=Aricia agestis TaxID=91739 RepID=UPI001C207137|nr:uncharacterized protein LOC121738074 isoform X2 [Aricia agestis]